MVVLAGILMVAGCSSNRKSSLLFERQARGPVIEESGIAQQDRLQLDPPSQTRTEQGLAVELTYGSPEYLQDFFNKRDVFGEFAGLNPYFPELTVFYVKIINHSGKKIRMDPTEFVVVDDKGNQYHTISPDYVIALADAKAPVGTFTRGVLNDARPGYFGFSLPVGQLVGKSQRRFALLKMATLQPSVLYDGVIYDGLITFWRPHRQATKLRVILSNVKTEFGPDDVATKAIDLPFEFLVAQPR